MRGLKITELSGMCVSFGWYLPGAFQFVKRLQKSFLEKNMRRPGAVKKAIRDDEWVGCCLLMTKTWGKGRCFLFLRVCRAKNAE